MYSFTEISEIDLKKIFSKMIGIQVVLSHKLHILLLIIIANGCFLCDSAFADGNFVDHFEKGIELFTKGEYSDAALAFEEHIITSPKDKEAYYFAAKAEDKAGHFDRAIALYSEIAEIFPKSTYAAYSIAAIERLNGTKFTSNSRSGLPISMPKDEIAVDFDENGRNLTIGVEIDNHPYRMIVDTAANSCVFGKNHLREIGIVEPTGLAKGFSLSNTAGARPKQKLWNMSVDLAVGHVVLREFPIFVTANMPTPYPSLGQAFLKRFNILIDAQDRKIHFVKRGHFDIDFDSQLKQASIAEQFQLIDDRITIDVYVNGRLCKMDLDTAATRTIFTEDQLAKLGISVPEDAPVTYTNTMIGTSRCRVMPLNTVGFGPIRKYDLRIRVLDNADFPRPLLGLDFLRGLSLFIDYDNSQIRFIGSGN